MYVNCKILDKSIEYQIREAARLSGLTLCGFVRWAVIAAAQKILKEAN